MCPHGLLLVQFSLCFFPVPNTMEDVHVFEGVAYVPIKFIRDKQRNWVSAGWLSKQMAHMGYMKVRPTSIGLSVESGVGHRPGDYIVSWATWLKSKMSGHLVHLQHPTFCGFQAFESPNETPRPPYHWSLGGASCLVARFEGRGV